MSRWWANPDSSEVVLKSVDDSDVVNGVGTALLGYHGLAMGILRPLATQTLVDQKVVREALDGLDLAPIAKALSNATRPIMGDSSDRYGQLLAEDIHKRASEATERLLTTWTATGMAWPNAVERASEVHGVPIERLGRYANVMKSASVSPLVRADYADRALMDYASAVGNRELQTNNELISKQDREFNEEDHPRNPNGQFKNKNAVNQSKLDKLNRLNTLNRTQRLRQVAPEQTKDSKNIFAQAASVTNIFSRSEKNADKKTSNRASNRISNRINVKRDLDSFMRFGGSVDEPMGPGPFPAVIVPSELFIALHKEDLKAIREGNGFFVAGRLGKPLFANSRDDLKDFADVIVPNVQELTEEYVLLRTNYTPITYTGEDYPSRGKILQSKEIAQNARFRLDETDTVGTFQIGRTDFNLPTTNMQLDNDGDFAEDYVANHDKLSDYEKWNFGKNLTGAELNEFNQENPRDSIGRFAGKNASQVKLDKLTRLNQVNRLREIGTQERQADAQKLSDVKNVFAQDKNVFAAKQQAKASEKISNRASNRIANRVYPMVQNNNPLDFNQLFGVLVSPDSPDSDVTNDYHLSSVLTDSKNYPMAPMLGSEDINDPSIISSLIFDFDTANVYEEQQKGPKPIAFDEGAVYTSATSAMESALSKIKNKTAQEPIYDGLIYQLEVVPQGEFYTVQWVPYPEDPYEIIIGSESDFEALATGDAKIEKLEDVSRLADLLAKRKDENLSELYEIGFQERASNPAVDAYVIKRGHNGGTK